MTTFSFRAEVAVDVDRFEARCAQAGLKIDCRRHNDEFGTDVEVEMESVALLEQLRDVMRQIVDGHTMLQTLRECRLADNSLERDMDLR